MKRSGASRPNQTFAAAIAIAGVAAAFGGLVLTGMAYDAWPVETLLVIYGVAVVVVVRRLTDTGDRR
jgi:hypothetical protein